MTTVLQPLPVTGLRALERDAAAELAEAADGRADEKYRRARADVRQAYTLLAAGQARERELARGRDQLQELVDILAAREAAGDAAGFDRLRAERELFLVEADRLTAAADRLQAQGELAGFFEGPTDPATLVVADLLPGRAALPDSPALVERGENTRGELRALERERESARLSVRAARRRRVPEPELLVGTKSSTASGGVGSVISVQAVIPLFDRGRPERALAEARSRQVEAEIHAFRVTLGSTIVALRAALTERRGAADRYRAASKNAAELERIARISYEAGERGILDLLDVYRTSTEARLRLASLDAAARRAEIELEFVSGWEMP
jgi:cobalt-zinc-cadmium efflux system outer membrane protein